MSLLNESRRAISDCPVSPPQLARLITLIEENTISTTTAKKIFPDMYASGRDPEEIVTEKGLRQISDTTEIDAWVDAAMAAHPEAVQSLLEGKSKAAGRIVGAVMQMSKGTANPALVNERIQARLKTL